MNRLVRATSRVLCAGALIAGSALAAAPVHATGAVIQDRPQRGAKMLLPAGKGQAYAWNSVAAFPLGAWYVLDSEFSRNSMGSVNHAVRTDSGRYLLWFPSIAPWGNVQVTAYGETEGDVYCKATETMWSPRSQGTDVEVSCYDRHGKLTNALFTVSYDNGTASSNHAYLRADHPTTTEYPPLPAYQRVPGRSATVRRAGVGDYKVAIPDMADGAGHAQVTAHGSLSDWCSASGSGRSDAGTVVVSVRCFTAAGAPADAAFGLSYTQRLSLFGHAYSPAAYAAGFAPTTDGYPVGHPDAYTTAVEQTAWIDRLAAGRYMVRFPLPLDGGTVHVSATPAEGTEAVRCRLGSWTSTEGVLVLCRRPDGTPADSRYTVNFTTLP